MLIHGKNDLRKRRINFERSTTELGALVLTRSKAISGSLRRGFRLKQDNDLNPQKAAQIDADAARRREMVRRTHPLLWKYEKARGA